MNIHIEKTTDSVCQYCKRFNSESSSEMALDRIYTSFQVWYRYRCIRCGSNSGWQSSEVDAVKNWNTQNYILHNISNAIKNDVKHRDFLPWIYSDGPFTETMDDYYIEEDFY